MREPFFSVSAIRLVPPRNQAVGICWRCQGERPIRVQALQTVHDEGIKYTFEVWLCDPCRRALGYPQTEMPDEAEVA